jgi:hypothetical protein
MDPTPQPEPEKTPKKSKPSLLITILRLFLTVLIAVLLGAGFYYGATGILPAINNQILLPIGENTDRIQNVEATLSYLEAQLSGMVEILDQNQILLTTEIASFQSTQVYLEMELERLHQTAQSSQATLETHSLFATQFPQLISTLEAEQSANTRSILALATAQSNWRRIQQEIELLRILEQFSHAHQFLLHSNFGLAEETLKDTRIELLELQDTLPEEQQVLTTNLLELVNQIIDDLPAKPAVAADTLELAWQLGISGLPPLASGDAGLTLTPTPMEGTGSTITPTPTPP